MESSLSKAALITGSLSSAIAVGLGAFGAHALKERLSEKALNAFEVGVRYQFYHSLALIALGLIALQFSQTDFKIPFWGFIFGILLFSGSLYGLSLGSLTSSGAPRWLGPITPLGGLCFLIGWIALAWKLSQ